MKTLACIILSGLFAFQLNAKEARLTGAQVNRIAELVGKEIYKQVYKSAFQKDSEPNKPKYDQKTGIWSCRFDPGTIDSGFTLEIRDKDAYYRIQGAYQGNQKSFRMSSRIEKQIANIASKKG